MKQIIIIIFLSVNSLGLFGQCTVDRFCLSFANPAVVMGGSHFEFDLVMSSNSDFGLGTSNVQFKYNNAALATPVIVSTTIAPPLYQTSSITTPFIPSLGEMVGSFNLELNTEGTGVNIPASGTTVCRLRFNITNPAMMSNLSWYYNGGTAQTVVFDHNESTQLCAVDPGVGCLQPSSSILPLELLEFKSTAYSKSILLEWKTDNELNSSHFDIERSLDGLSFNKINTIAAFNDISGSNYSYDDTDVITGIEYYYRLKIVDLDGKYEYSRVILNSIPKEEIKIDVYPNPVSKNERVTITINQPLNFTFTLMDAKNSVIMSNKFEQSAEVSLESLSSGVYYYQIEYGGTVKNGKLIIL